LPWTSPVFSSTEIGAHAADQLRPGTASATGLLPQLLLARRYASVSKVPYKPRDCGKTKSIFYLPSCPPLSFFPTFKRNLAKALRNNEETNDASTQQMNAAQLATNRAFKIASTVPALSTPDCKA